MTFLPPWIPRQVRAVLTGHTGPVCNECGAEFYYDFVPQKHLGSGLCLNCFEDRRNTTQEKT